MRNRTNVYMSLKTPTPSQQAEQSANVYAKANIILQGGSVGAKTFSKTTLLDVLMTPRHSAKRHCWLFCWRQDIQQNDTLLAPRIIS
jgi:hypothetical protein